MNYEQLKLQNQLCFPLYACAREVVKKYTPFLEEIGLTYTQYLVMLVLWEREQLGVKELGDLLHLDSGTLTPLLKRLEASGLVVRARSSEDERRLLVTLTEKGRGLEAEAVDIPQQVGACLNLSAEDMKVLYQLLYRLMDCL